MCKIDVVFCDSPDLADHIEQMIFGLQEAAPEPDDDEDEWGPDSATELLERGPR